MPNIVGTNGSDNIDVTNDDGTLNGVAQGTPIDDIRARSGDDTIVVTDSTITGTVSGNAGNDDITISGSTISGVLNSGAEADTVSVEGSTLANIRLGSGDDTLDFQSTTVSGDVRGGTGTDSLNLPDGTVVNDATSGTFTVTAGSSYSLSSGSLTLPSGITISYTTFENGTGFPCFNRDTLIDTPQSPKPVQSLKPGDLVKTASGTARVIRWVGKRKFDAAALRAWPNRQPVRILAGSLGDGLPARDLLVSRQHRMLIRSKIATRMFGQPEVLIPAIKLTGLPGIFVDTEADEVEYFHLLLDEHDVIFAEGAPTESLLVGPGALRAISVEAYCEIADIFPECIDQNWRPCPARYIPPRKQQRKLIARHIQNNKPLIQHTL